MPDINKYYHQHFESMDEYKEKANFNKILNSLSLNDVTQAIENAEKIESYNLENYRKNKS